MDISTLFPLLLTGAGTGLSCGISYGIEFMYADFMVRQSDYRRAGKSVWNESASDCLCSYVNVYDSLDFPLVS